MTWNCNSWYSYRYFDPSCQVYALNLMYGFDRWNVCLTWNVLQLPQRVERVGNTSFHAKWMEPLLQANTLAQSACVWGIAALQSVGSAPSQIQSSPGILCSKKKCVFFIHNTRFCSVVQVHHFWWSKYSYLVLYQSMVNCKMSWRCNMSSWTAASFLKLNIYIFF